MGGVTSWEEGSAIMGVRWFRHFFVSNESYGVLRSGEQFCHRIHKVVTLGRVCHVRQNVVVQGMHCRFIL